MGSQIRKGLGDLGSLNQLPAIRLGVSTNNGAPKSSTFNGVFHYKPSILGYPYFWKHPFGQYRAEFKGDLYTLTLCSIEFVDFVDLWSGIPKKIVIKHTPQH